MSVRSLVILPDTQLRLLSKPLTSADKEVRALIEDMFETMYDAPGIGLAAIQVGVPLRAVTVDCSRSEDKKEPLALLNPEIVWYSEELREMEEGCLSIPEYYSTVERPDRVRVKYRDLDFKEREIEADGILATCLQHEIDHLNGVLFIDHLSKLKRDRVIKKFSKLARHQGDEA